GVGWDPSRPGRPLFIPRRGRRASATLVSTRRRVYPDLLHPQREGGTSMIGYTTVGTNDLKRAAGFYDALLAELGAKRAMEMDTFIAWAAAPNTPMVAGIN